MDSGEQVINLRSERITRRQMKVMSRYNMYNKATRKRKAILERICWVFLTSSWISIVINCNLLFESVSSGTNCNNGKYWQVTSLIKFHISGNNEAETRRSEIIKVAGKDMFLRGCVCNERYYPAPVRIQICVQERDTAAHMINITYMCT